ncbi:PREDICTED: uncharacterized protein LOC109217421 [Nicotiana attenuata]|uniref:uncharacterized protein LOC109217421 n=1 Tax=Nicotiana attenuata TaxID=49451 RepID=UPI000904D4E3|nr:PREDICTED: uncharacterized protein LOC109217421 [Nicotiana attenuata]
MTINNSENLGTTVGTSLFVVQVDANGTQSASGATPVMNHNHPLYLHSTDSKYTSLQGTPMDNNLKLTTREYDEHFSTASLIEDEVLTDRGPYQRLIEKLLYLTVATTKKVVHEATQRIIKYIKNEPSLNVLLSSKPHDKITAFCDADWATCPQTKKSITGFLVKTRDSTVSWKSKK